MTVCVCLSFVYFCTRTRTGPPLSLTRGTHNTQIRLRCMSITQIMYEVSIFICEMCTDDGRCCVCTPTTERQPPNELVVSARVRQTTEHTLLIYVPFLGASCLYYEPINCSPDIHIHAYATKYLGFMFLRMEQKQSSKHAICLRCHWDQFNDTVQRRHGV